MDEFKARMHKSKEKFDKHKSTQHAFSKLSAPEKVVEQQRLADEKRAKGEEIDNEEM